MSFFGELKRRNVVKVAVAYAIVGWLLIEVSSTVLPTFEAPLWVLQTITFVIILGFPLALVLSWVFDLTSQGVTRTEVVAGSDVVANVSGRKLDFAIIGALVLALGFVVYNYESEDGSEVSGVLPNSVAVLPFENLSLDPENAFFAAGIHEEVLNQLVKLSELNVIARTSMLQYADGDKSIPEVADELNVETVMEGSVRYADGRVLVTAQLIDPATNAHLWSDSYNREFADVFAIQSDIAMSIANALEAEFSLEEQASIEKIPTGSSVAHALYLRAVSIRNTDRAAALSLLDQAIEEDPNYADAHAMKAYESSVSLVQTFGNAATERARRANLEALVRRSADQALLLDPSIGLAHSALALIDQFYWRWEAAQEAYERALEVSPNDPGLLLNYAWFRSFQGDHHDEAIDLMQRVVKLNPTGQPYYVLASVFAHAGDPDAALAPSLKAVEVEPLNALAHMWLGRIEGVLGNDIAAAESLAFAERLLAGIATPVALSSIAYTYSRIGYEEDAIRVLKELGETSPDHSVDAGSWVLGYLVMGDHDRALDSLQSVVNRVKNNEPDRAYYLLMLIKSNAESDPVLDESGFVDLRRQIGSLD